MDHARSADIGSHFRSMAPPRIPDDGSDVAYGSISPAPWERHPYSGPPFAPYGPASGAPPRLPDRGPDAPQRPPQLDTARNAAARALAALADTFRSLADVATSLAAVLAPLADHAAADHADKHERERAD